LTPRIGSWVSRERKQKILSRELEEERKEKKIIEQARVHTEAEHERQISAYRDIVATLKWETKLAEKNEEAVELERDVSKVLHEQLDRLSEFTSVGDQTWWSKQNNS